LGVQQAILGRRAEDPRTTAVALDLDPGCDEAQRLVSCGLAELSDDRVALVDPKMAEIVTRSSDHLHYIQTLLKVFESTSGTIGDLADTLVTALEDSIAARYTTDYVPAPGEMGQVVRLIQEYRDLGSAVVAHQLDRVLQQHMVSAVSDYTTRMVASGQGSREPVADR
jgi:hypothetical protein